MVLGGGGGFQIDPVRSKVFIRQSQLFRLTPYYVNAGKPVYNSNSLTIENKRINNYR